MHKSAGTCHSLSQPYGREHRSAQDETSGNNFSRTEFPYSLEKRLVAGTEGLLQGGTFTGTVVVVAKNREHGYSCENCTH